MKTGASAPAVKNHLPPGPTHSGDEGPPNRRFTGSHRASALHRIQANRLDPIELLSDLSVMMFEISQLEEPLDSRLPDLHGESHGFQNHPHGIGGPYSQMPVAGGYRLHGETA
jgi:hypothetical protein